MRQAVLDDAEFIVKLMNEKGYLTNVGDRGVRTVQQAADYIKGAALYAYQEGLGFNLVELRQSGAAIGICGLVRRPSSIVEIGYGLLDEVAGQGYATEAAQAVVSHAFEDLALCELFAVINSDNHASRNILHKLGMSHHSTEDDECTYRMGVPDRVKVANSQNGNSAG